ncbi:MAG: DNA cytosine methyltransferase [Alphaproteobacteria bacterium]|nr:DNA cytosine methyltransferase [Alphaproteobacteria bacterium]
MISLFCGAGGLDLGFERAGFSVSLAVDLRSFSIDSHNHNRERAAGHIADVTKLDLESMDGLAGRTLTPIGIIGGPPCQSFSRAAHSAADDPRHNLPHEFVRILRLLNARQPVSFFAFENVPGLLKKKHEQRYKGIVAAFAEAGFTVASALLNALDFGVAQDRPRLILVGFNEKLFPGLIWVPPEPATPVRKTVKDLIMGLPQPQFWQKGIDRSTIKPHPNHWCMVPKSKNFTTDGALVQGTSRGRSFRTLHWERPSPTIAYGNREVHVHPDGRRRLSVYEALLLQGFPEDYELLGSLSAQITQISEAVPPPLAEAVAMSISAALCRYRAESESAA